MCTKDKNYVSHWMTCTILGLNLKVKVDFFSVLTSDWSYVLICHESGAEILREYLGVTCCHVTGIFLYLKQRCSFEENKQINLNDDHSDESLKCSDEIATSKSTKIHNGIDIKEYLRSKTGAKLVEQDLINEMSILGVKGYDTVDQYFSRKSKPFEGTSDENLLRMCGTITEVNVTRQRSNSICAVFTASFDIEHDEKEWFYKLKIMCDEKYELHVINDLRLQMKYETLKSETQQKEYRTFRAKTECQSKKSIEEFEMIYKQMKTPQFRLENCIQTERNLLCRFMLARITPSILIVDSLKIAMDNQLPCISMAISWYLVRHYVAQSQVKNLLGMTVDIWPGYFCKCLDKGHSSICSKEPVIVVEAERHLDALPDEYLGIQVLQSVSFRGSQLMEAHNTDETEYISNITSHSRTIQPLPCNIVENLFLKHSKLTMTYISSEMPEYVQLCCQVKGIIPIGEDHFPAEVFNLKTYVSEGHVLFLQNIFVGQRISKEASFSSYGTLGGFVKYRGKPAALTCAHVFYDRETLLGGSKRDKHETEVDTFCRLENDTVVACGYVVHDAFEYDTRDKTSVDAAVVRLNTDILVDENAFFKDKTSTANPVSHLGMTSPFLNDNYITHRIIRGTMTARSVGGTTGYFEGQITYEDYDADDETFIKNKLEHGVVPQWENLEEHITKIKAEDPKPLYTPSDVYFQKTIVPTLGKNIQHKRYFVRFYKQLLLENFPCHPGDSGACIYVTEDKTTSRSDLRENPTGCLGMMIANYIDVRDGKTKCIVTPMQAILKELGLI